MIAEIPGTPEDEGTPYTSRRDPGIYLAHSGALAANVAVASWELEPRHELVYIYSGRGQRYVGSQMVDVQAGDLIILAPGPFRRTADEPDPAAWSLSFRADAIDPTIMQCLAAVLGSGDPIRLNVPAEDRPRWERRFHFLSDELQTQHDEAARAVRAVVDATVLDVVRLKRSGIALEGAGRRRLLDAVFRFIDEQYRSPIGLREVAAAVHFSPAYLTDLVRRQTGHPIRHWITERRMSAARLLLIESDRAIAEIAVDVGFRDATTFGRTFLKIAGQSPRAWREARRAGNPFAPGEAPAELPDYASLQELAETFGAFTSRDDFRSAVADAAYEIFGPGLEQILHGDETAELTKVVGRRSAPVEPIVPAKPRRGTFRLAETEANAFSERDRWVLKIIGSLAGLALRGVRKLT